MTYNERVRDENCHTNFMEKLQKHLREHQVKLKNKSTLQRRKYYLQIEID